MKKSYYIIFKGINFNKESVFKMSKTNFLKAYKDEDLFDQIQSLKPKKKKKNKSE